MSRKMVIMWSVLAILLLISITEQIAVRQITDSTLFETRLIMTCIRQNAFEEAWQKTEELDRTWDRQAKMLEVLVDHGSTDEVRYAFSRLMAALEEKDSATSMIYVSELEGAIEHVFERQELTIENIL